MKPEIFSILPSRHGHWTVKLNPDWFPEITKENSPKKIKLIIE